MLNSTIKREVLWCPRYETELCIDFYNLTRDDSKLALRREILWKVSRIAHPSCRLHCGLESTTLLRKCFEVYYFIQMEPWEEPIWQNHTFQRLATYGWKLSIASVHTILIVTNSHYGIDRHRYLNRTLVCSLQRPSSYTEISWNSVLSVIEEDVIAAIRPIVEDRKPPSRLVLSLPPWVPSIRTTTKRKGWTGGVGGHHSLSTL